MKIVFMGTPEFAVPSLEMLNNEGYEIAAVVTQPDKPKGRGKKLAAPPVKEFAINHEINVLQPEKVRTEEFIQKLVFIKPDILITVAYGKILPKAVLDIPQSGCINVHGSLLPKYRGPAPINWSIINGEKKTGITTMYTDIGMDTGDILLKREIEITNDMTARELNDKLSLLGAEVLKETIRTIEIGKLLRIPQNEKDATYAPILKKDLGEINWLKASTDIHNLVRGTIPWPSAYTFYKGERVRIWKTQVINEDLTEYKPGTIIQVSNEGMLVACGKGFLKVKEVQFDSSRRMTVEDYICGHTIDEGEILG
jgi:methionyl-tRNA formyltransferase